MKTAFTVSFLLMFLSGSAQWIFWTEEFGTGCQQGQLATAYDGVNGTWTVTETGLNEVTGNVWYISAMENNTGIGNCGETCGMNQTLHIGNKDILGIAADQGAAYYEGLAGFCGLLPCGSSDLRIESPAIDCTSRTNIDVVFTYLEGGNDLDNATFWYYDGTSWTELLDMDKTFSPTCSPQGLWVETGISLPTSAHNNPDVRIGIRWTNNDDGVATDPSIAIDNIIIYGSDPVTCVGDFNNDGLINSTDLLVFLGDYGCLSDCEADLNGDGVNDAIDLLIFLGAFGSSCF